MATTSADPVTVPKVTYRPAWWLRNGHAQTIWGRMMRSRRLLQLRREVLETADGDELVVDHLDGAAKPRFVLLHGLEGSSNSVYIQGMLARIRELGCPATAVNFRSCACDPSDGRTSLANRRPRLYHSGETGDADFVFRTMAARYPGEMIVAIGVSLGGNVLLKWLGENAGQRLVAAAATLSVPYDLEACARFMEKGMARVYTERFLRTLRVKVAALVERFPELRKRLEVERGLRASTFWEYDDAITGPLHGFAGAGDYYARSSSLGFAGRIDTPVLALSAHDDPFVPPETLVRFRAAASRSIELQVTPHGGHVGFVSGAAPWAARYWAEGFLVEWASGMRIVERGS